MILGYFNEGRPFVDGLLRFPGSGARAARFLVDTGADLTIVHPIDYRSMGLSFADFKSFPEESSTGVGGRAAYRRVPVELYLRHDSGQFDRLRLAIMVARSDLAALRLPSLLGRDVTDLYVLTIARPHDRLSLEYP
jgi:hypothetical protein